MPCVFMFTLMRWMTHLNIGAFLATLLWLCWMHGQISAALPAAASRTASTPMTLVACAPGAGCRAPAPEVRP